ncbi:MAG: hypothetical protein AB7U23_16515, partial [Dehalococcoidia bacterium]
MKRLITLAASSAVFVAMALILTAGAGAHEGHDHTPQPTAGTKIAAELGFVLGTAIGPDNALYVADGSKGEVWRIDPDTGAKTLEAWGL